VAHPPATPRMEPKPAAPTMQPAAQRPAEPKPAELKPAESKPAEPKPVEHPRPMVAHPPATPRMEPKPAAPTMQPAAQRPAEPKPAAPAPSGPADAVVSKAVQQVLDRAAEKGPEYEAIAKLSREVIEQIVWEVVPDLAEVIIKEHIEELAKKG